MQFFTRLVIVSFGTGILIGSSPLQADDRKEIIGVWKGGMPGEPFGSIELTITPTKITGRNSRNGKSIGDGTYQLDPATKTIDSQGLDAPVRGKTYFGIYSLEGNTLKWASTSRGKKRPSELVHKPEKDIFLIVLERQK